ncbi:MAG: DUF4168 domain-containing protein [Cyanobacteria bacterium P01_H01_bin.15]
MIAKSAFSARWKQLFAQILVSGALSTGALTLINTAPISWEFALRVVQAQNFSDAQLRNYAQAVLDMEVHRQEAFIELKQVLGNRPVPNIQCNSPRSYRGLPRKARRIVRDYCRHSEEIVTTSGLTVSQFNSITTRANSDIGLEKRIQNTMLDIRTEQRRAYQKSA